MKKSKHRKTFGVIKYDGTFRIGLEATYKATFRNRNHSSAPFAHLLLDRICGPQNQKAHGTGAGTAAIHPSSVSIHFTVRAVYSGFVARTIPPLAKYRTKVTAASALDAIVPYVSGR